MTADRLAGALEVEEILALCDQLLGEVGRRRHIFAWLRAPDGPAEEWLPVDAYYPGRRLVVICRDRPEEMFEQLVPAHGLRLLKLEPGRLGGDRDQVRRMLETMIERLVPPRASTAVEEPSEPAAGKGPSAFRRLLERRPTLRRLLEPRPTLRRLLEPRPAPVVGPRTAAAERAARVIAARRRAVAALKEPARGPRERSVAYQAARQLHLGVVLAMVVGAGLAVAVLVVILRM
jgi:hypothetical protein